MNDTVKVWKIFGIPLNRIKLPRINWVLITMLLSLCATYNLYDYADEYMFEEQDYRCYVRYKHHSPPAYRVSEKHTFYLMDEKGRNFSCPVTYPTFKNTNEKAYVTFTFSEHEINNYAHTSDPEHRGLLSALYMLMFVVSIIMIIWTCVDIFGDE